MVILPLEKTSLYISTRISVGRVVKHACFLKISRILGNLLKSSRILGNRQEKIGRITGVGMDGLASSFEDDDDGSELISDGDGDRGGDVVSRL